MTIQLVDPGTHAFANLNGVLSWAGSVDASGNELFYDGAGNIFASLNFASNSNYWTTASTGAYQFVQVTWSTDNGVSAYDVFLELYVCLNNPGNSSATGYMAAFYHDGIVLQVDIYDFSGFGPSFITTISGTTFPFVGDYFGLEYIPGSSDIVVYHNSISIGSVTDSIHNGDKSMAIGIQTLLAGINGIYMEQPAVGGGPWTITPTGKATSQAFGTPVVAKTVLPTGKATTQGMGTVSVLKTVTPTGIASGQALGVATATKSVSPSGIPTSQRFGVPTIIGGAAAGIIGRDIPMMGVGR